MKIIKVLHFSCTIIIFSLPSQRRLFAYSEEICLSRRSVQENRGLAIALQIIRALTEIRSSHLKMWLIGPNNAAYRKINLKGH